MDCLKNGQKIYEQTYPEVFWGFHSINSGENYRHFLTEKEKQEYNAFNSKKRKREWLSSRVLLRSILLRKLDIKYTERCFLEKDRFGCPSISLSMQNHQSKLSCSIGHKNGIAVVCVARRPDLRVGIDIELISDKARTLKQAFATKDDFVEGISGDRLRYTLLWGIKEAASKALGLGMLIDFKTLQVTGSEDGKTTVRGNKDTEIQGKYFIDDLFVVSICQVSKSVLF